MLRRKATSKKHFLDTETAVHIAQPMPTACSCPKCLFPEEWWPCIVKTYNTAQRSHAVQFDNAAVENVRLYEATLRMLP